MTSNLTTAEEIAKEIFLDAACETGSDYPLWVGTVRLLAKSLKRMIHNSSETIDIYFGAKHAEALPELVVEAGRAATGRSSSLFSKARLILPSGLKERVSHPHDRKIEVKYSDRIFGVGPYSGVYFGVFDNKAFWFEGSRTPDNKLEGIVNFNNPETAVLLSKAFEKLWQKF